MIDFDGKTISVLGTTYSIFVKNKFDDEDLDDGVSGFTDLYNKHIVLNDLNTREPFMNYTEEEKQKEYSRTLRHEIIHAYLYESGLDSNSGSVKCWARNEEMVDWLAMQLPKIYDTYCELGILQR